MKPLIRAFFAAYVAGVALIKALVVGCVTFAFAGGLASSGDPAALVILVFGLVAGISIWTHDARSIKSIIKP